MSGGAISLESSVRTCDVNVGEANRIQSDRFFNPSNMVCIPWNGLNNKGQEVCPDSHFTKTAGCDSAEDRVMVENNHRPKYSSYVTLSASGINGGIYGNETALKNSNARSKMLDKIPVGGTHYGGTGQFGNDFGANINYHGCSVGAYERAQAQMAQASRNQATMNNGYESYVNRRTAGGF